MKKKIKDADEHYILVGTRGKVDNMVLGAEDTLALAKAQLYDNIVVGLKSGFVKLPDDKITLYKYTGPKEEWEDFKNDFDSDLGVAFWFEDTNFDPKWLTEIGSSDDLAK